MPMNGGKPSYFVIEIFLFAVCRTRVTTLVLHTESAMRLFVIALAFGTVLAGTASAQSTLCADASLAAEMAGTPAQAAQILSARCKPGDVVFLQPRAVGLIGLVCDFTKSIVQASPSVLCIFTTPRAVRP